MRLVPMAIPELSYCSNSYPLVRDFSIIDDYDWYVAHFSSHLGEDMSNAFSSLLICLEERGHSPR